LRIALVGLSAVLLASVPAFACPGQSQTRMHASLPPDFGGGDGVKKVMRGDRMAVTCDGVDFAGSEVRVVLNFSADDARSLGYQGVLATDQSTDGGALNIRVPNAPDLANHTVSAKVFMLHGSTTTSCDAGKVRVAG
jgi:hypothetical protein